MNLVTAAKMMALLEQMSHEGPEDDAYFIIHRLLKTELKKGEDAGVLHAARMEFLCATRKEVLVWMGDKLRAVKMYRERTGSGIYEAKSQLEAGERSLQTAISGLEMDKTAMSELKIAKVEVTSCD
jgi:ribosomal protein L7/L12